MNIFEDAYRDHLLERLGLAPLGRPVPPPPKGAPFERYADLPLGEMKWGTVGLSARACKAIMMIVNRGSYLRYTDQDRWHNVPVKTVRDLAALGWTEWRDTRKGVGPATIKELVTFFGRA